MINEATTSLFWSLSLRGREKEMLWFNLWDIEQLDLDLCCAQKLKRQQQTATEYAVLQHAQRRPRAHADARLLPSGWPSRASLLGSSAGVSDEASPLLKLTCNYRYLSSGAK